MDKDFLNFAATDVFLQAESGFAVPVDPDLADAWRVCRVKRNRPLGRSSGGGAPGLTSSYS